VRVNNKRARTANRRNVSYYLTRRTRFSDHRCVPFRDLGDYTYARFSLSAENHVDERHVPEGRRQFARRRAERPVGNPLRDELPGKDERLQLRYPLRRSFQRNRSGRGPH